MKPRDLAYLCYLPPGLFFLLAGLGPYLALPDGWAGGIGLLVLVPIALFCLPAIPYGLYLTLRTGNDLTLWTMAFLTVLVVVQMFAEFGPVWLQNGIGLVYGLIIIATIFRNFLKRQSKEPPA